MAGVKLFIGGGLIIISLLGLAGLLLAWPVPIAKPQLYGVSFSAAQGGIDGLDWQKMYDEILDDLEVKHLRLGAYWDVIEPKPGQYDFSELDYQMDRAAEVNAQVILAVGRKLPRWPECHEPNWLKEKTEAEKQAAILVMLPVVVERYRDHPALRMWQLENEPLLNFGDCLFEDEGFLSVEEQLLRKLDSNHPILITDSGELNSWLPAAAFGDVLGTTMYRTVFSGRTNRPFHYDYIFPAWLYRAKARLVGLVRGKSVLISELQGEPWGAAPFTELTETEKQASFSVERFGELRRFARRTQLPEAYWWGVEYWYWEKEVNDNPVFWEMAKGLF